MELRRHMRIRGLTDIRWSVEEAHTTGAGTIVNISRSGLLMFTDEQYVPSLDGTVRIDSLNEQSLEFGSKTGKIVWQRRLGEGRRGYQCGVEFLPEERNDELLQAWIDRQIEDMAQAADTKILNHYIY